MRVLGIAAMAAVATAGNVCDMTAKNNRFVYMKAPKKGEAANGIDYWMDYSHCKWDGSQTSCVVDKCTGNMIASGKATMVCMGNGQMWVDPNGTHNLKCVPDTKSKTMGVPNKKKMDLKLYFRFYQGSATCDPKTVLKDVSVAKWPDSVDPQNNPPISTLAFGTGVTSTIRAFPGPHPKLDPKAHNAGGATKWKSTKAVKGKPEFIVSTYDADLNMQKFWNACKLQRKALLAKNGYYGPDHAICLPLGQHVSFDIMAEWGFKGEPITCRKTDIEWGSWWAELPVGKKGGLNVGSVLFLILPAVLTCCLCTCLVGFVGFMFCMCKQK